MEGLDEGCCVLVGIFSGWYVELIILFVLFIGLCFFLIIVLLLIYYLILKVMVRLVFFFLEMNFY